MALPEVTSKERAETVSFWTDHLQALWEKSLAPPDVISFVAEATQANNIGYGLTLI